MHLKDKNKDFTWINSQDWGVATLEIAKKDRQHNFMKTEAMIYYILDLEHIYAWKYRSGSQI